MTTTTPASTGAPPGIQRSAMFEYLGRDVVEMDTVKGYVKAICQARPEFCNPGGVIQGGFLTAMLDDVMSFAAVAHSDFTKVVPTLDFKASFLAPVTVGDVTVEGSIVKSGRSIAYLEGKLYNSKCELAVIASATTQYADMPEL
jgi:uncharacterized protein (TIGR00369 family)